MKIYGGQHDRGTEQGKSILNYSGVLIYLVTVKNQTQQKIASIIVVSFSITFLVGTFWGAQLRVEFEKYSHSEKILLYKEAILQNVRLQKLEHERQILDFRLLKGLPIN